jgi:putative nucleotidyltransferase with HDIG domain
MVIANKKIGYMKSSQGDREIYVDTPEYTTRLELLYEVAQKATSYSEVLKLIQDILNVTQRILQASSVSLLLIDKGRGVLYYQPADGKAVDGLHQVNLDVASGIIGGVARSGVPVIANDVSKEKHFDKDIDEVPGVTAKSIMAVPLTRGDKVVGVLRVINKTDGSTFSEQDLTVLEGLASTEALLILVSMVITALNSINLYQTEPDWHETVIESLVSVADIEGPYATGHSQRVREYTMMAAKSFSLSPEELKIIEYGALLHDIGKIGVDDDILLSSDLLTDEQWSIIRKHPWIGASIVGEIPFLKEAKDIVLSHHE